ncbi:hypothetical protein [Streptomyces finlayi]|uniref:Uncharacterized protein n=1 Tax=Streptomyces finlayi TaxID=67296 RepID=A0A7G7BGM0_9ACTN|nr:hypothetical protein [Streptomyces finlayi]QNE74485.1 hypothetical protein F0344_07560 [Streptomyces finlayi]
MPIYHRDVALVGAQGHGRTSLAAAISRVVRDRRPDLNAGMTTFDQLHDAPTHAPREQGGMGFAMSRLDYSLPMQTYSLFDCPTYDDYLTALDQDALPRTWAILVVNGATGPTDATSDAFRLLARTKTADGSTPATPHVAIAFTHADQLADEGKRETLSRQAAARLMQLGVTFNADRPTAWLSPAKALDGDMEEADRFLGFLKAADEFFPRPGR